MSAFELARGFLQARRWEERSRGEGGRLFVRNGHEIGVPYELNIGNPDWESLAERVAVADDTDAAAVSERMRMFDTDVIEYSIPSLRSDSVRLRAGAALSQTAWQSFRAAASTAVGLRSHIAGSYPQRAREASELARMGHSLEGSFVIPVFVELDSTSADTDQAIQADQSVAFDEVSPEPFTRRSTRTLAEAMVAIDKLLVQPAVEPRPAALGAVVAAGGSKELVAALVNLLQVDGVSDLSTSIAWAESTPAPSVQKSTRISASAAPILAQAAAALTQYSRSVDESFSGPIVRIAHYPDSAYAEVTLLSARKGRQVEVTAQVPAEVMANAYGWARDRRTIILRGVLERVPHRALRIVDVRQFLPLDETFIAST